MKGQTYVIISIILTIIIAIFAVMNVSTVEVNYLFWQTESPLILVILLSVLMGGLISSIVGMMKIFQLQKKIKTLKSEQQQMQTILEENQLFDQVKDQNKSTPKQTD